MSNSLKLKYNGENVPSYKLKSNIVRVYPESEELNVTPHPESQTFSGLYDTVNVSGDNNLTAENIKKDVSIFGVEGIYEPEAQELNITPSSQEQSYEGLYNSVSVAGDANLVANNIKKDVSVFGVQGTFEGEDSLIYNQEGYSNYAGFASHIEELKNLDLSDFTSLTSLFYNYRSLKNVTIAKMPTKKTGVTINLMQAFSDCMSLVTAPTMDTSNIANMQQCFEGCTNLANVPIYNTSNFNAFGLLKTFRNCSSLSSESLNNIMQMCINATGVSASWKNLKSVGLTQTQAETCMTLPNYQAFLDAGWTTGY